MKKILYILMLLMITLGFTACGETSNDSSKKMSKTKSVDDVINEQVASADNDQDKTEEADSTEMNSETKEKASEEVSTESISSKTDDTTEVQSEISLSNGDVDVDLTLLSSTLVYSEVYNMMSAPDSYMGKKIRMSGNTAIYHDDYDGNDYYACVIMDATACCAQGIEFQLKGGEYPNADDQVTVSGIFSSYEINGQTFYTLKDAVLE